jgi:hypothetical protein
LAIKYDAKIAIEMFYRGNQKKSEKSFSTFKYNEKIRMKVFYCINPEKRRMMEVGCLLNMIRK